MKSLAILVVVLVPVLALAESHTESPSRPGVEIAQRADDPRLNDLAIAASIAEREPDSATDSYSADVGSLYCWSSVKNSGEPTEIKHVWSRDGKVVWEKAMTIGKSTRWRTWTKRRINPKLTGSWACEVVDANGESLGKATVTVQ